MGEGTREEDGVRESEGLPLGAASYEVPPSHPGAVAMLSGWQQRSPAGQRLGNPHVATVSVLPAHPG